MTLRALVGKEIYIRLEENEMTLVCTIRCGRFRTKVTKFPVEQEQTLFERLDENEAHTVRVRNRFQTRDDSL